MKLYKVDNSWTYKTHSKYGEVKFEYCEVGDYKGKTFMIPLKDPAKAILVDVTKSHLQPTVFGDSNITIVEEVNILDNKLTYAEVFYSKAAKGYYCIDGGDAYFGFSFKQRWNGWEMPYFEKDEAIKIAKMASSSGEFKYKFFQKNDTLTLITDIDSKDPEDRIDIKGHDILTESGEIHHVYNFGLLGWIWEETKSDKDIEENKLEEDLDL